MKVLDIDRDRQRISLGLKQTQEDPWQRIVDTYNVNDELAGKVTKVVTFGAFVEILDGVEGLVHISELAPHHVESPREVVHPGEEIRVRILEIDSERRRLSLSAKRVEDQILPLSRPEDAAAVEGVEDTADKEGEGTGAEMTAEVPSPEAEIAQQVPEAEAVEVPSEAEAAPEVPEAVEVPSEAEAAPEVPEAVEVPSEAKAAPEAPEAEATDTEAPEAEPGLAAEHAQD